MKESNSTGEIVCPSCGTKYDDVHDILATGLSGDFECGGCERIIHYEAEACVDFYCTMED